MLMVNDRVETAGLPDGRPTVAVVMAPLDAQTPSDRAAPLSKKLAGARYAWEGPKIGFR